MDDGPLAPGRRSGHHRRRRSPLERARTITCALPAGDPFALALERELQRRLPPRWRLETGEDGADLRLEREVAGGWRLACGTAQVGIDDLAAGAMAARHLAALGARDLRYAGPPADGLRLRGFAIAAGALGIAAGRLAGALSGGALGVFADGEAAESAALAALAAAGLTVPRDALLLGIEDGALRPPRAPGVSRLRIDPAAVAEAALAALRDGGGGTRHIPPAGVVTRASSDDLGADPHLAAALAHLRAHLHRPLDVQILAQAAGMPRRSLERLFRSALGRTPLDEIRRQRIARAQELLAGSDLPLDQIAARCGFSGPDRLGVVFRQVAGCTPGAWRRQHLR